MPYASSAFVMAKWPKVTGGAFFQMLWHNNYSPWCVSRFTVHSVNFLGSKQLFPGWKMKKPNSEKLWTHCFDRLELHGQLPLERASWPFLASLMLTLLRGLQEASEDSLEGTSCNVTARLCFEKSEALRLAILSFCCRWKVLMLRLPLPAA